MLIGFFKLRLFETPQNVSYHRKLNVEKRKQGGEMENFDFLDCSI
jgi:hypothetical protein